MINNKLRGLYVITDPDYCGSQLLEKVAAALQAGASIVQYRNKAADTKTRLAEAGQLAQLCAQHNRLFIVNDDIELALAVNADGVHLGQTDNNIINARNKLGNKKIIGISCHQDLELALQAQQQGADYVAFGRFFPSHTKPEAPAANIDWLPTARSKLDIPVVAIGGITLENAGSLLTAGADMLAVIHAVMAQEDVKQATAEFVKLLPQP